MAMMSTEQTADMERAIAALALELPAEVWEDVRDKWHAARDSMTYRIEQALNDVPDGLAKISGEWVKLVGPLDTSKDGVHVVKRWTKAKGVFITERKG